MLNFVIDAVLTFTFVILFLFYGWCLLLIHKYASRASPVEKDYSYRPTFSIVIPTYNESRLMSGKLEDIFRLDYPQELIEIVIVDSSTDDTPQIIREAQKEHPNIRLIIEEGRRGLATALNTAYAAAKNDIVLKTDCDSFIEPGALKHTAANFANPGVGAVTGKQVVINESRVEEGYRASQTRMQIVESWLDSTIVFHGPFSAYRRSCVVEIDPDSLADDSELAVKVRKQGYRALIDPEIKFYEASQSRFFKRRKQKDRRGYGLIRLLLQHRDVPFNKDYGKYGSHVFPMNYFMMIFSPWLLVLFIVSLASALFLRSSSVSAMFIVLLLVFIYIGQADRLYKLQPVYSFLDAQISLLVGGVSLAFGASKGGLWEVDESMRDAYLKQD